MLAFTGCSERSDQVDPNRVVRPGPLSLEFMGVTFLVSPGYSCGA